MTNTEAIFIWLALWIYGVSFISYLYGMVFKKDRGLQIGLYLLIAGFVFQIAAMLIRWSETGHPPVMREFENATLGSFIAITIFLLLRRWYKKIEVIAIVLVPVVLLMIGNGIMSKPYLEPMAPPFKSNWLWLHIVFAWIAYASFCIGAGLGILYLLKERAEKKGDAGSFYDRIPTTAIINDLTLRMIIFGFVALTVQVGAGAIWAYGLWGRYWGWDPLETWSLITWLIYGTYIHLGMTLGWKGRKMAWLAILCIISLFITYGGIGFMASVHTTMM